MMPLAVRRVGLTAHVVASVGWIGAVMAYLALAIVGLTAKDDFTLRAVCVGMRLVGWFAVVPFCIVAQLTGIVQSLGTPWGLFRHYWVLIKLLITAFSTWLLLVHMGATDRLAAAAARPGFADLAGLRVQMTYASALAVAALLVMTVLSVYKPRGLTPIGWRRQARQPA